MDSISSAGDKDDYSQMNQSVYTVMSYNSGFAAHPLGLPSDCGSRYMASFAALDMAVLKSYYGANNSYNDGSNTYTLSSKDNFKAIWDSDGSDEIIMGKNSNAVIAPRAATLEYEAGGAGFVFYNANTKGGYTIANGVAIENAKGGSGNNTIAGNDGSDNFVCILDDASTEASTTDHITDFIDGTEVISLDNGLSFNDLTFSQNGSTTQIINTSDNNLLFYFITSHTPT